MIWKKIYINIRTERVLFRPKLIKLKETSIKLKQILAIGIDKMKNLRDKIKI